MGKPLNSNPAADLPVNWTDTQIISANGTTVGLSQKHGYNYLGGKVNEALTDIGTINDFCGKIQQVKKTVTLAAASWVLGGTAGTDNYYEQTFSVSGYTVTSKTKPDITVAAADFVKLVASKTTCMYAVNDNGVLKMIALKNAPTQEISADVYLSEVDA